ncbi:hypothetical protein CCR75_005871 [Bremia lactucae]|uniref:Uncharacterized protein n=1 Tax=Bremia lactucae TaxID=4779 RepID=A0A976FM09_BRELC|nr:hypothetical protein CCR75_005871 [Bremia lactucae]
MTVLSSLSSRHGNMTKATSFAIEHGNNNVVRPVPTDWTAHDRCSYYPARTDGCTEPRSCRDCLNLDVRGSYSCMVNHDGRCVQQNRFNYLPTLDFRYQKPSNAGPQSRNQRVQFLANQVNYCQDKDVKCQACRATVFADVLEGSLQSAFTKFCYGSRGCVCIAICEAPLFWKHTIGLTVCNGTLQKKEDGMQQTNAYSSLTSKDDNSTRFDVRDVMKGVAMGIAGTIVLVVAILFIQKRRKHRESSREQRELVLRENNVEGEPLSVPELSLFGWQSMRAELMEREQLLLAGVEDFSNVRTGYLQLLDVDASAPPPEDDISSAPNLLALLSGASAPILSPNALPNALPASFMSPSAPLASPSALFEEML